ncbi:MAG: EamA family transporter, partial [Litorimonas sp.]
VKKVTNIRPLELLAWFALIGSCCLWPLSFIFENNQLDALLPGNRWPFLSALAYTVILVSLVAHASYYWLLQRLPMHMVAPSGLLTTLIGVGSSALLLKEPLGPAFLIGGGLTLGGIGLILWRNRSKALQDAS